jgi:CO/xanthine dehydrogenase Mo-binding subunit
MEGFQSVGQRIPKKDAPLKVTGSAIYIQDLKIPGMLHGKILYSKYPHAKILKLDTSKAEKLPGVRAVLTGATMPAIKIGVMKDNPPLKSGKVCSLRDEIAAVAAISPEVAEEALDLIEVEYEELPGVFDPIEAMKEGAPLIHEEAKSNVLKMPWKLITGDVEEAKKNSAYIVQDTFTTPWVSHCCLGTSGVIAAFNPNNELTMYSNTQIPSLAQKDYMEALGAMGLKNKKVRIIQSYIGGAFGSKLDTYSYEYIAIVLALKTRKPVKIIFSREEEFFATSPRQCTITKISQGCDKDGKLTFREMEMILDNGAYTSWGATTPSVMMLPISSLYKVPNIKYTAKCVYTNNTYSQAMRGYGNPQATFAIESSLDQLAEIAGIDPYELRLKNANEPGEVTPQNFKITSCGMKECMDEVVKRLDWKGKHGKHTGRGVGMASLIHVGGGARVYKSDGCGTIIKVDDFGKVDVFTGSTDMGQGSETVIAQMIFPSSTMTPMYARGMLAPMQAGPPLWPATLPSGLPGRSGNKYWKSPQRASTKALSFLISRRGLYSPLRIAKRPLPSERSSETPIICPMARCSWQNTSMIPQMRISTRISRATSRYHTLTAAMAWRLK